MNLDKLESTHTDRVDVTLEISLNEYGLVRNPNDNDTIFCLNPTDDYMHPPEHEYEYRHVDISLDDVREALEEASEGFFSFIGSSRSNEISTLNNESLTHHIMSLNMYNGYFSPYY
jgi:hypothetical protein